MTSNAQLIADAFAKSRFSSIDWIIVTVYILFSFVIGWMMKKYVHSMDDYIGAGRAVGTRLGIATMTGTEMGLITVMYNAQNGYTGGFASFHIALAAAVVTLLVGLTGFIVYRLREFNVLTIPEYYEKRFGRKVRIIGGIMLTLGGVLNMGLFLKVGSMFIVGITGMSDTGLALPIVMTVLLVLVLAYTVMGGMISVIITDYVQFVVLSIGVLVATALAIWTLGWSDIFSVVQEKMGEGGFNPFAKEGEFGPEYVLWTLFTAGLVSCAIWPTAVARALAMESPKAVQRQYTWSSVSFMMRFLIPSFWGICAFVFVTTQAPDLYKLLIPQGDEPQIMGNLYAMPAVLGRILPIGVLGILTAAMIAAFMSTHDSYLLCWSSVITQDIIAPLKKENMSTESRIFWTRAFIIIIGGYIWFWGIFYKGDEKIWDYMQITGAIYFSGAFSLLVCGLYWKRASSTGAVISLFCGLGAILGLSKVQEFLGIEIASARIGLGVIALTVIGMVAGSLLFPDKEKPTPESKAD